MSTADEQLSALVDDELGEAETERMLGRLAGEPDLRDAWARYQLIGTAIRRGIPAVHDPDLATRVIDAIGDTEPEGELEASLPAAASATGGRGRLRRSLGGFAMAASVAAVALLGVRYLGPVDEAGSGPQTAMRSSPVLQAQPVAETVAAQQTTLDRQRLNDYLLRHNEFAASGGLRSLPPYVRVVSAQGVPVAR
ncbi:MAG: sigma-E factor negative regulatory protein [Gammaproteobacteria bacterium]|nr:sigma-E factor negative regulatory protein [Gammaproteobacteria bacterium]